MTTSHVRTRSDAATRPVIRGQHLVVSCGHYLASVAGLRMMERGGNAFDAGVAMVFAQSVMEWPGFGFGGEAPILIYSAAEKRVVAVNGNTRAPMAATREWFAARGIDMMPGDGFLSAGVPAVPDALITVLDRYGTMSLKDVLTPAIELADSGFPVYESFQEYIQTHQARFRNEWPTSAALFLPGGKVPGVGQIFCNSDLASTFVKLVEAEESKRRQGRRAALQAARDRFYRGDIAESIISFQRETTVRDANGFESGGLLASADLAGFRTRLEEPVSVGFRGLEVFKPGPWCQGPVFLQQLKLLEGWDLQSMGHNSPDYVHLLVEVSKLAFADRERYFGDPRFVDVPLNGLLSSDYAAARRKLISMERAMTELVPGNPFPFEGRPDLEPDLSYITGHSWLGGTTGTRAVDRAGNMFSATPSGGWLHTSPIIEGLGFCLGTRCQMFWLGKQDHPNTLQPGKQPRSTLSPTLVMKDGEPYMVFGTPGGDQQDQWSLQFFLNHVEFGMDIQEAIDQPVFHTSHFHSSFFPRECRAGHMVVEGRVPRSVINDLEGRGHSVQVQPEWGLSFITAVKYGGIEGCISGAASSRGEKEYALGW